MPPLLPVPAVVGTCVLWVIIDFYRTVLTVSLDSSDIDTPTGRAMVLVTATALLFAYFAIPGLAESDDVSLFIGRTSLMLVPVVILVNWRRTVTPLSTLLSRRAGGVVFAQAVGLAVDRRCRMAIPITTHPPGGGVTRNFSSAQEDLGNSRVG